MCQTVDDGCLEILPVVSVAGALFYAGFALCLSRLSALLYVSGPDAVRDLHAISPHFRCYYGNFQSDRLHRTLVDTD